MKSVAVVTVMGIVLAGSALAGEMISGTNAYVTDQRTWKTGEFSGYYMYDSSGTMDTHAGPMPNGPVECHGAGFWTPEEIMGEGICIFGEAPHRWTVAFAMDPGNKFDAQRAENYRRRGTWKVLHGTGKYVGVTGTGSFVTGPVVDGQKTTQWEGEVELPK
jgi:hypothetical protein